MKKLAFIGVCLLAGFAATAQEAVVKEAERDLKAGKYLDAINKVQPALTNPETAKSAQPWYIAGKAGFDYYKDEYLKKTIGKEADGKKMGHALIDGYHYLITALPLDTVINEKGKAKTKYSKDIIKLLQTQYSDFNNAAVFMWDEKDFKGAYDAWDIVIDMPVNPVLGKNAPEAFPESTMTDIMFNQGLAAWQMDSLAMSLAAFERAIAKGYDKPQVFEYAINHAARLGNNDKVFELAEIAYKRFGNQNPLYLQLMINGKIEKKEYEAANKMLDEAIAANPGDAQLYNIKGILYESMEDTAKAKAMYEKAVETNPNLAQAQYNLGRTICNEAYAASDKAQEENLSNNDFMKLRTEVINPLFKQAAEHLEIALKVDPDNSQDVRTYLRNIYYNLGDDENMKRIENF